MAGAQKGPSHLSDVGLPLDILRKVLLSSNLSLADLAQISPTCHYFRRIYVEAFTAEQAWLEKLTDASDSMFGPSVVDALCEWLFSQYRQHLRSPHEHGVGHSEIDITEGAMHPQPQGPLEVPWWHTFELKAPGCGLRADGKESEVMWTGDIIGKTGLVRRVVFNSGVDKIIFALFYNHGGELSFYVFGCPVFLLPTFIGFLHRILDEEAEIPPGRWQARRRDLILCLPSSVQQGRLRRRSAAGDGGDEVQRALSALLMSHWHRWNIRISS